MPSNLPFPESDSSDASSIASDDDISAETLYDRLFALQDMLPPTQRRFIASTASTTTSWVKSGLTFSGKALWVVSTSLLLLGVPWALAYAEEQQMIEMEKEMQMQQQASNLLTQPSGGNGAGEAKPAL
jgi:import receptor subunit TOM22